ncbi:MAG: Ig-like domain-containing protein, partial [Candidatus Thermoplasmatota archaeon]|nr:Ig-like domain-containing protein [Candidatus Thermoplasmatota archaeon]
SISSISALSTGQTLKVTSFKTEEEPDTTPPTITDHTPTGDNIPIDTIITVIFNEPMNQTSAENAFIVSPMVDGDFAWNDNTMIFTPTNPLSYNETYNVTITTDATDVAGNHLGNNYSWGFTTEKEKVNHKPVIKYYQPLFNPTINEIEYITFNITATDIDNDNITYSWYINDTLLSEEINDSYTFISNYTSYGVYEIKVIVTDDGSPQLTDNHIWTLTVLNKNRPPVLQFIENRTAYEGQPFILQINASDPDNDTITFSDNTTLFEINSTTGFILFTPDYDSAGTYMINITVSDEEELVWRAFKLTVLNVNRKPILDRIDNQTGYEGQLFTLQINSTDLDGDTLTFSDNSTLFDINATTGLISFIPNYDSAGIYLINISVTDGEAMVWQFFNLTIVNVNRNPTAIILLPSNNMEFTTKDNILFYATGSSDPDNDDLTYSWSSDIDGNIGNTPSFSRKLSQGIHIITLTVDDGHSGIDTKQTTIVVNKPSEPSGGFIPGFEITLLAFVCLILAVIIVLLRKHKT